MRNRSSMRAVLMGTLLGLSFAPVGWAARPVAEEAPRYLHDCPAGPLIEVSPLAYDDFTGLVPLGNLNPPGHTFPTDHLYFYVRRSIPTDPASPPASVPVVAPGDAWITEIRSSEHLSAVPPYADYDVLFSPCRQFRAYFGHVSSLAPHIQRKFDAATGECQEYSTGGELFRLCRKSVKVRLRAGEALGTTGGRAGQNALDMGAFDARVAPLPYANPARFYPHPSGFDSLHVVCPVDYFAEPARGALRSRFGDFSGTVRRTVEPLCGEVEQDEPGAAQGIWFVAGTTQTYPEDPHLALVHDNVDPTLPAFSVGVSMSREALPAESRLSSGVYYVSPQPSGYRNREFRDIAADGQVYCYDALQGRYGGSYPDTVLLVQLTGSTTLRIERRTAPDCGGGPWSFTSAYTDFER